jgi:hypothetical protein
VAKVQGLAAVATGGDLAVAKVQGLAAVATGGDLAVAKVQGLATVATSGQYTSLANQPTIPAAVTQVGQLGAGTIGTGTVTVQGTLNATADVVAYYQASDDRLKNRIGNIQGALEKVNSLNGFIYKFNDLANNFGFNNQATYAGLSAQELNKVLPEAVKPMSFTNLVETGNNYMRVEYEKVVPLLVESIKELSENLRIVSEHIGLVPKQA